MPAATLPAAADRAFEAVGHVPLAVALLAAAVRGRRVWGQAEPGRDTGLGGRSWEEIAADLVRDADVYGTHPYATTFRALHIAVAALPDDLRAALLGLAVFPPDSAVPVAAIARYWAHTRGRSAEETVADLDRLIAAEVLQRGADTDTIGFHDLAHEYLLLHADALPTLHEQLLDAYRGLLDGSDQWWTLPLDEPYVWEHLATHLAGAGDRDALVATVTDPAYQAKRIARDGPHAGETDLAVAARIVRDDPLVAWWRAWLSRHAHLLGGRPGPDARRARVAMTMLAWLEADPSRPTEVQPARLAPLLARPYLAVHSGLPAESTALIRVLAGHGIDVNAVGWSPDGNRLATTAGGDGTARIWDATTGEVLTQLIGCTDWVRDLAWSPDGNRLATTGTDGIAHIWDATTGEVLIQLIGHTTSTRSLAWSPDGTRLATVGGNGTTHIWDATTGEILTPLTGHTNRVQALAWSPDGTRLATAGFDGTAHICNPTTGQTLTALVGHTCEVGAVAWSPDNTRVATAGVDGITRIWSAATGRPLARLTGHTKRVLSVAWSPDSTRLVTGGEDCAAYVWDPAIGRIVIQMARHAGGVWATAWSPDGTRLATAGGDGAARIWDPTTGSLLTELTGHTGGVWALTWSPDGDRLVTAAADDTVRIWNPSTGTAAPTADSDVITAAAWSPDGTCLAAGRSSGTVQIWYPGEDHPDGHTLAAHTSEIRAVAWSPDGRHLATAGSSRTVRLWKSSAGRGLGTLEEPHQCSSRRRLVPGRHSSRHRQRREDPALETRRQPMARPYRCTDRRHPRRPLPLDLCSCLVARWHPHRHGRP